MTFTARFGGTACGDCEERIRAGDEVEYNGQHVLVHALCPEVRDLLAASETCPRCFLELPATGECGVCT